MVFHPYYFFRKMVVFIKLTNVVHLDSKHNEYSAVLTTISGKPLGQIPSNAIKTISCDIGKPYEIVFNVPKFYMDIIENKKKVHPLFSELKNERQINVDNKVIYSIKSIETVDGQTLKVKGKSREIRLSEIQIDIEDTGFTFFTEDKDKKLMSLEKYLYEETGWKLGIVTDKVRYKNGVERNTRWFESVQKKWYDFLKDDICESFECMMNFDTVQKTVNFFMEEELGDDIGLYLSKDNYIKSLKRTYDSDKIITRMKIVGNEDMDIAGTVVNGSPYIENFSYFMEIKEMSEPLIKALEKYYEMVEKREPIWKKYKDEQTKKRDLAKDLGFDFANLNRQLFSLENSSELHLDAKITNPERKAKILHLITQKKAEVSKVRNQLEILEKEISDLDKSCLNLSTLCQKETATDDSGNLIFNQELLDELKEYYYTEIYHNDSFLTENVEDLVKLAQRKLRDKSNPTSTWNISLLNFLEKLNPIGRLNWCGELSLGDVVILYDEETDTEEFIYFVGYKHHVSENKIEMTLSNKKTIRDDGRTIADYLTDAKNAMRAFDSKKYLLIQQKYNRLNLPREFVPKYKEEKKKRPDGVTID